MSRRARQRRDKRAPSPDFDDPQPRMPGLSISGAMTTPPDWPTADRAYQHHHAACPQCRAAGTSPNTQQRCPEERTLYRWSQGGAVDVGSLITSSAARATTPSVVGQ